MGEYHLVLAVLESAMHDFQTCLRSTDRHGQRIFAEAATWLFDEDEHNTEGFSFAFVCDVLGLDPGSVRDRLRRTWYGARATSMPDLDTVSVPLALAV
jgi:hypothetical protein